MPDWVLYRMAWNLTQQGLVFCGDTRQQQPQRPAIALSCLSTHTHIKVHISHKQCHKQLQPQMCLLRPGLPSLSTRLPRIPPPAKAAHHAVVRNQLALPSTPHGSRSEQGRAPPSPTMLLPACGVPPIEHALRDGGPLVRVAQHALQPTKGLLA